MTTRCPSPGRRYRGDIHAFAIPCRARPRIAADRAARGGLLRAGARRPAHGLYDHRQFAGRKGDLSATPARRSVSVRRAGGTRPSRLARLGLPPAAFSCDLLVISGHFDDEQRVLFGSGWPRSEFLPVAEMERVSCSDSCPGLFSQLKEVYLFGCNTLNADAVTSTSPGSRAQPRPRRVLARRRRERLGAHPRPAPRRKQPRPHAPHLHRTCLSSMASPRSRRWDPAAATLLGRYLQASSLAEVGSGRASPRLLGHFAAESDDRRQRPERIGSARRLSARVLSIHRRSVVAGAETRLHPRPPAAATWRKSACSSSASKDCSLH